jgi:hypothetical protein
VVSGLIDSAAIPGGLVRIEGSGYGDCRTVYLFYDGQRLGTSKPGGDGGVVFLDVPLPGDADPGRHRLTTSCDASGRPTRATSVLTVKEAPLHRSTVMTSIPKPSDVDLSPRSLMFSALLSALLGLLIAFPGALLDATVDEHYNEIRGWFGIGPRKEPESLTRPSKPRTVLNLVVFLALGATAGSFLDPDFGLNQTTLALAVGLMGSLLALCLGLALPNVLYMGSRHHDWGQFQFLPGALLLTAVLVLVSKFLDLQPGYLYGVIGGLVFGTELSRKTDARVTITASLFALVLSLLAWIAWVPVSAAAARPDAGFWHYAAEVALGGTFIAGLEGVIIGLLPVRSMSGSIVKGWSFSEWLGVYAVATFVFVLVLVRPGSDYGADPTAMSLKTLAFASGFAVFALSLWAYFRFRDERETEVTE